MNQQKILLITTCLIGSLISPEVFAEDGKVLPGSACLPYTSASGDIMQRFAQYVKNTSGNFSMLVTCPVIKDHVAGTRLNYIRISYTKTNSTGFYCAIFARTATGGGSYTSSEWDFNGAGTKNMVLDDINGYSSGSYSLYCIVPPGGTIHSYRVDEA